MDAGVVVVNGGASRDVDGRILSTLSTYCAHAMPGRCFYSVTTCARCYAPWYKSVIQLGVGLYGIHNLGPTALSSVYPVETSTSLYNLYVFRNVFISDTSKEEGEQE